MLINTSFSLTLLSLATLLDPVTAKKHSLSFGRHAKLVQRSLFEGLGRRSNPSPSPSHHHHHHHSNAPYGVDRCGLPRTHPQTHKANASPLPSSRYKKCPPGSPEYEKSKLATDGQTASSDSSDNENTASYTITPSNNGNTYSIQSDNSNNSNSDSDSSNNGNTYSDITTSTSIYHAPSPTSTSTSTYYPTTSSTSTYYPTTTSTSTHYPTTTSTSTSTYYPPASSSSYVASSSSASLPAVRINAAYAPKKATSTWIPSSASAWTSSSSSSKAPATTAAPSNSGGSGMMGLAWDYRNPSGALAAWTGAPYIYTWSAYPPSDPMPDGMQWYPHFWGPSKQSEFQAQVSAGIIKPGMTILGYNEPDQPGQSNLAVGDAINLYKQQITPYASQGYRLATPGCVNDDTGFAWIQGFVDGCAGQCGFSVIQTHFYGTDAQAFISYIQKLHDTFNMPIIISEWAAETFGNGPDLDPAQTQAFLATCQSWLEAQSWVESYFYFGPVTSAALNGVNPNNQLIEDSGSISGLGWQYFNNGKN